MGKCKKGWMTDTGLKNELEQTNLSFTLRKEGGLDLIGFLQGLWDPGNFLWERIDIQSPMKMGGGMVYCQWQLPWPTFKTLIC